MTGTIHSHPLVVDLDGTLTHTDTLVEALVRLFKESPLRFFGAVWLLLKGRARFKAYVAEHTDLQAATLPYNNPFLEYLKRQKLAGRKLVLATASHQSVAQGVAAHLELFDEVIATNGPHNLKGEAKLQEINAVLGEPFAYAGDSTADVPIWSAAQSAVLVGVSPGLRRTVSDGTEIEEEFSRPGAGLKTWFKALRLHQWVKNLLLFVPLVTSFEFFNADKLWVTIVAFVAFSLTASATYIVNDLWDLDNDRNHPRKRFRPLAAGDIAIARAVPVAALVLLAGLLMALWVSPAFLVMVLLYLLTTCSYSWLLKSYVLIDVIILAMLFTLRILAGSVASGVVTSEWLLAFSIFLFLSLALVKRCSELVSLQQSGEHHATGRNYRVSDLVVFWPLGLSTAVASVVVFGLFINTPDTIARYNSPTLLWLIALGLTYWLSRLWVKTARGEMDDDPIVYAIKDRGSRVSVILMGVVMVCAYYFKVDLLF